MKAKILTCLLMAGILNLVGCGGGGGELGNTANPQIVQNPLPNNNNGNSNVTALQRDDSSENLQMANLNMQQVEAADLAASEGNTIFLTPVNGRIDVRAKGEVPVRHHFTSEGNTVVEFLLPIPEDKRGARRITRYNEELVAGVNFQDSDANGVVNNIEERESITAGKLYEQASQFAFDFENRAQMGTLARAQFAGDGMTVSQFEKIQFQNQIVFEQENPESGAQPSLVHTQGQVHRWRGPEAQNAAQLDNRGEEANTTIAEQGGRFRSSWDLSNRRVVHQCVGTQRNSEGQFLLSIGQTAGQLNPDPETRQVSGQHQGDFAVFARAGNFDLERDLVLDAEGFSPLDAGLEPVHRIFVECAFLADLEKEHKVTRCSITNPLARIRILFELQNDVLNGAIFALTPEEERKIADITFAIGPRWRNPVCGRQYSSCRQLALLAALVT